MHGVIPWLKQKYEGIVMFKFTDILDFFMGPRLYMGGGGGGQAQPTQTTVNNTSIPEYARPYVANVLMAYVRQHRQLSGNQRKIEQKRRASTY